MPRDCFMIVGMPNRGGGVAELGELLVLLHGAPRRYETVRLTARTWRHLERSRQAYERWAAQQQSSRTIGRYAVFTGERERPEETQELLTRLWLAPELAREETEGAYERLAVRRGKTWWLWTPEMGALSNEGDPNHGTSVGQEFELLLDPARMLPEADFEPTGEAEVAGRRALLARALARGGERFRPPALLPGADEHELAVDAERGIVLWLASFLDGEKATEIELLDVAFDERFPTETFTFVPPPGEQVQSTRERRARTLTLREAVARASFPIFVPDPLIGRWQLHIHYQPGRGRAPETVHLGYHAADASSAFSIAEWRSGADTYGWAAYGEPERVERSGQELRLLRPPEAGMPSVVMLDRDGTHIEISSQDLEPELLLQLAGRLRPASAEPPRL